MIAASTRTATPARRGRRLKVRHLWSIPGLALAIVANMISSDHSLGLVPVIGFGILPHLPVLAGLRRGGRLGTDVASLFNGLHHPGGPVLLIVLGGAGILSPLWLVSGLAWLSHIVIDRALGDGHRHPDGSRAGPADR
jgi:hypothetical protein